LLLCGLNGQKGTIHARRAECRQVPTALVCQRSPPLAGQIWPRFSESCCCLQCGQPPRMRRSSSCRVNPTAYTVADSACSYYSHLFGASRYLSTIQIAILQLLSLIFTAHARAIALQWGLLQPLLISSPMKAWPQLETDHAHLAGCQLSRWQDRPHP
jgi:hypothetical protein